MLTASRVTDSSDDRWKGGMSLLRLCFDTSSNYYWNGMQGYLSTPAQARSAFEGDTFKFYAATMIDMGTSEVTSYESPELFLEEVLAADELITFNGRTCDLIVLEKFAEPEQAEALWLKTHHDLKGWLGCQSLRALSEKISPEKCVSFDTQLATVTAAHIKRGISEFLAGHLANTYRDAYFTSLAFAAYDLSGNNDHTFIHVRS